MFVAFILWIILGFIQAYTEPGISYGEPELPMDQESNVPVNGSGIDDSRHNPLA